AGAPRWNVGITTSGGQDQTFFFGCYAAAHSPTANQTPNPSGVAWCHDSYNTGAISSVLPAGATIRYLAIVFDEGTDNPIPQPPGCSVGPSTPVPCPSTTSRFRLAARHTRGPPQVTTDTA